MKRPMAFAENLRHYRKKFGWTQHELAEKIGYTEKSVSKWENGNGLPTGELLLSLAELFEISLDELVFAKTDRTYLLGIDGGGTKTATVADVSPEINQKIKEYSARLVSALGVRHISRIDFFLSGEDIYFNEINTMPGFTAESLYPRMLAEYGIDIPKMVEMLIGDIL